MCWHTHAVTLSASHLRDGAWSLEIPVLLSETLRTLSKAPFIIPLPYLKPLKGPLEPPGLSLLCLHPGMEARHTDPAAWTPATSLHPTLSLLSSPLLPGAPAPSSEHASSFLLTLF